MNIENHGSLAALGCKVFINDVKYGKSDKNIKSVKSCKKKQLRWTASEVDMPIGIPNRIKLFEIINPNIIITRERLLEWVWPEGTEYVEDNALSVAIRRLRDKLEDDSSNPQYIKTVYGKGYMWENL